ncbi:MAG: FHA domain-containing protein [Opitutales bacterium]
MNPLNSRLCVYKGNKPELAFPLNENRITIGRSADNVAQLDNEKVSKHHAVLFQDSGNWIIRDLDSANGTRVNGESIDVAKLNDGDKISIGPVELNFELQVRDGEWVPISVIDLSTRADDETIFG